MTPRDAVETATVAEADAKWIRRFRELAHLSQAQVATSAGISAPYLSLIERGRKVPPLATICRIAIAIGTLAATEATS